MENRQHALIFPPA